MAQYRKRGKNWEYRIRYIDPISGKKSEHSKGGFKTKPEAEYAASQAYLDIKDGNGINMNQNILFKDFADSWFEGYKATVKETSLRSRKAYLNVLKEEFQNLRLKNLTLKLYQKKLNELSQSYKKNTVLSFNQIMQMIAKQAVIDGYFKSNPISNVKIPHYDNKNEKIEFWENATLIKFKEFCLEDINKKRRKSTQYIALEKERDLTMYYLMIYGGLRIGETCALSIHDYFPLTKEIDINKTLGSSRRNQVKSSWKIYPPKTKSAYRTIPLPEIAYKQLEKWIRLRKEYIVFFSEEFHESHYLFCKKTGEPLTPRDLRTKFNVILERANLPKISPHGLRHTYTALQIQAGTDPKSLQILLGHADIKTTLNIYAHLTEDKKRQTISKFDEMLKSLDSGAKVGQEENLQNNQN